MYSALSTGNLIKVNQSVNYWQHRVMAKAGANDEEANMLGEALLNADYRSHFSHGLNRLEFYYNDMKAGAISSSSNSQVKKSKYYFRLDEKLNIIQ